MTRFKNHVNILTNSGLDAHSFIRHFEMRSTVSIWRFNNSFFIPVSYQTRYCTQINIDFEGPMRTGCVQEFKGSEVVEVCACKSQPGPDGICNSSFRPSAILSLVILIIYRIFIGFSWTDQASPIYSLWINFLTCRKTVSN